METNLTKEYLDRITRSCGGTVAKPATINTRSDAASTNEAATAVAGAGQGVPAWKVACKVAQGSSGWWSVSSPTEQFDWSDQSGTLADTEQRRPFRATSTKTAQTQHWQRHRAHPTGPRQPTPTTLARSRSGSTRRRGRCRTLSRTPMAALESSEPARNRNAPGLHDHQAQALRVHRAAD